VLSDVVDVRQIGCDDVLPIPLSDARCDIVISSNKVIAAISCRQKKFGAILSVEGERQDEKPWSFMTSIRSELVGDRGGVKKLLVSQLVGIETPSIPSFSTAFKTTSTSKSSSDTRVNAPPPRKAAATISGWLWLGGLASLG
jgi:hypothetical protein